jgi:hypothetical protein
MGDALGSEIFRRRRQGRRPFDSDTNNSPHVTVRSLPPLGKFRVDSPSKSEANHYGRELSAHTREFFSVDVIWMGDKNPLKSPRYMDNMFCLTTI